MIIPNQMVETKWVGKTRKYYESKSYLFTKINDIFLVRVEDLSKGSTVKVKYICDYCNGEKQIHTYAIYSNIIKGRKHINKDCCSNKECINKKSNELRENKKINYSETLAYNYPKLTSEWNTLKNKKLTPDIISKGSNKKVWWICDKGHEWEAVVCSRTLSNSGCPFCAGRKVSKENNLANINPELAKEWHPTKNGNLTPYDVTSGTNTRVWWKCSKNHEWKNSINSRGNGKRGCPYCAGKKVGLDNSLATVFPEIAREWHSTKNGKLTPYDVTKSSNKNVWWLCKNNHNFKASVNNRNKGTNCPYCNESKGEKYIRALLENNQIKFITQYEFNDLTGLGGGNLRFDFAIFNNSNELISLIEYDGEFHFKKIYKDDNYEIIVEHDKMKNLYCEIKNIPLLRIPYWDYDNIEGILENELKTLAI